MSSRLRALGVAALVALALGFATRTVRIDGWYAAHAQYRAQVDALLAGRLALSTTPDGLAYDLAWTGDSVQQVWGLGAPLWQTPFEAVGRLVGISPFPDRIPLLAWIALATFALIRGFVRRDEPWWIGAGCVLIAALLPGFVAMMRGRIDIYEEAAIYAYGAALMLLGGLASVVRRPTRVRLWLLLAGAGATGLVRPTAWFYGLATAIIALAVWLRARRSRVDAAIAAALFVAGGGALYATNYVRFGAGTEFGHRLNLEALPGNIVATRFGYPFEHVGFGEAAVELVGSLFDRPETRIKSHTFYQHDLHVGQSPQARWREYYFTTYSWPYLPLLVGGLVLGAMAWRRRDGPTESRWLVAWTIAGGAPLAWFYLHSPSVSSRYQLDLAPAFVALLMITWRQAASWLAARGRSETAVLALVVAWGAAIGTSRYYRPGIGSEPVDRDTAAMATYALSRPLPAEHPLPGEHDLADPLLPTYTDVLESFDRCADDAGTPIDCDAHAIPGDTLLHGTRSGSRWILARTEIDDDPPVCELAPVCAIDTVRRDPRAHVDAVAITPPALFLDATGWSLTLGAVPPSTYFFVDDPAFIELDVEHRDPEQAARVRVIVGRTRLSLASIADTERGVRLRFTAPDMPRGLQVAFIAFGDDDQLDRPISDYILRRIRWRD
jgi:hypothetical protein